MLATPAVLLLLLMLLVELLLLMLLMLGPPIAGEELGIDSTFRSNVRLRSGVSRERVEERLAGDVRNEPSSTSGVFRFCDRKMEPDTYGVAKNPLA